MSETEAVWYVSYGSNLDEEGLSRYVPDDLSGGQRTEVATRWIDIRHPLYFAGHSRTWDSSVAFLSLNADSEARVTGRAYLLDRPVLRQIARMENGYASLLWDNRIFSIEIGEWAPIAVELDSEGFRGKYNALLRLPDIDSRAAFTITTSRLLPLSTPAENYARKVYEGIVPKNGAAGARDRMDIANAQSPSGDNYRFVNLSPSRAIEWSGVVARSRQNFGYSSLTFPEGTSGGSSRVGLLLGEVSVGRTAVPTWISFTPGENETPSASSYLLRQLGLDPEAQHELNVVFRPPVRYERMSANPTDIPDSDVVNMTIEDSNLYGKWILLVTSGVIAPFRVKTNSQVPPDKIRLAYAGRTLLGLSRHDMVQVQSIKLEAKRKRPNRIVALGRAVSDRVLGAPTVALRATEGLVGDEGRAVVRVDQTALDFMGCASGDRIFVSWADRGAAARVLLQSTGAREWMDHQLAEDTGRQQRSTVDGAKENRSAVPPHLRVWMSPTLRTALDVPPDTIVRVRRSVRHLVMKNLTAVSFPVVGLIIAAAAIPNVPWEVWGAGIIATLVINLISLRVK